MSKLIQEIARKKLKLLETRLIGVPLRHKLKDFYSIHFHRNKYRLIYWKKDNTIEVLAVHVGKRTDDFYKDFERKLKL